MGVSRSALLLLALTASVAPSALMAQAQSAGTSAPAPSQEGIADIIVTANRREEAIQSVPVAVTAISASSLREQNINSPTDLLGRVPSLNVASNGTQRDAESITIRGQGQTYLAPVGVVNYFAEVPLIQGSIIANQGGPGTFFDAESLQVLRGPQGTLFGKNTTGGALLIGPARPTNRLEGWAQAQIGNYQDREFEGVLNVPLIDDVLMVRLGARKVDRDGYTKDVGTAGLPTSLPFQGALGSAIVVPGGGVVLPGSGPNTGFAGLPGANDLTPDFRGRDYDDRHYWTARLGVLLRPMEGVENFLVGTYTKAHNNGTGQILSSIDPSHPNLINLVANAYGNGAIGTPGAPFPFDPNDSRLAQQLLDYYRALGPRRTALSTDQFYRLKTWSIIDTLSVDITDEITFRNIFGYQRMKQSYNWDLDGSYLPIFSQVEGVVTPRFTARFPELPLGYRAPVTDLELITEEPQFQGRMADGKVNWVVGGFYSKQKPKSVQATGSYNGASFGGGFFRTTTTSKAVYGQATVDLGAFSPTVDGLKLTGGIRHTWDEFQASRIAPDYVLLPAASAEQKTEATTWTLGLDYQANDDVLLYGKATKGYKAGGFNYAAPRLTGLTFGPEKVMSYEIGAKTDLRLGSVPIRFNVAAYQLNYRDIQRANGDNVANGCPDAGNPFCNTTGLDQGAITYNIGKARVRGIELETTARLFPGFELAGSYSYTKAKYRDYTLFIPADAPGGPQIDVAQTCDGPVPIPEGVNAPLTAVNLVCSPFPFTPKHQFAISPRYSIEMGEGLGTVVLSGSYSHASRAWTAPATLPGAEPGGYVDSYDVFNAAIEWNDIGNYGVDARLFATNLTNTTYRISNSNGDAQVTGFSASIYNEPRMYGVSLRFRFGQD